MGLVPKDDDQVPRRGVEAWPVPISFQAVLATVRLTAVAHGEARCAQIVYRMYCNFP